MGMGANPAVLWAIADRLAQPEGEWKPFERSAALARPAVPQSARFRLADLIAP